MGVTSGNRVEASSRPRRDSQNTPVKAQRSLSTSIDDGEPCR